MRYSPSCYSSILQAIGNTPLIKLERLGVGLPGNVLVKAEFLNPSGSFKDRIALKMIEDAEKLGKLNPGGTVVELTSGNTGSGLALVCALKGYRFIAVMSEGNSVERRQMIKAYGGELELVPQGPESTPGQVTGEDLKLVEERAAQLVEELGAFWANQFDNPSAVEAHHLTTAQEIIEQTQGKVDVFLDVVGTASGFIGIARGLKEHNPHIRCLVVEPATAPFLAGKPVTNLSHKLQGSSYAFAPGNWDGKFCDGYLTVTDEEAVAMTRKLASLEGIMAGYTSGGNVAAALKLAADCDPGTNIVTLICDTGLKYLSTDLYKI